MIELPGRRTRPNRLILFFIIFAIVAALLGKSTALSYYVDALWFGSLGYSEDFWKSLGLEWSVFGVFFAATFLILYSWFLALWQMHQPDLPHDRAISIGRQRLSLPLRRSLSVLGIVVSLGASAIGGVVMMAKWPTFALFRKSHRIAHEQLVALHAAGHHKEHERPRCLEQLRFLAPFNESHTVPVEHIVTSGDCSELIAEHARRSMSISSFWVLQPMNSQKWIFIRVPCCR